MRPIVKRSLNALILPKFDISNWLLYQSCYYQSLLMNRITNQVYNENNILIATDINVNVNAINFNELLDGLLHMHRNRKTPVKANHGKLPLSHVGRFKKREARFHGPRWWRKELKKRFQNSEDRIFPGSPWGPYAS